MTIDLVYQDEDVLAFYKPSGMPTVPLKNQRGGTLLEEVSSGFPEVMEVEGKNPWEGGVLHRLDTPTRGLVLFARSQKVFDYLEKEQEADRILKTYHATVRKGRSVNEGFEPFFYRNIDRPTEIQSWFRAFGPKGASVRPVLENERLRNGRMYTTEVTKLSEDLIEAKITRGFRHQIRSHLAWAGYPIVGDTQYGGVPSESFGLESVEVSFRSPSNGQMIVIHC